MSEWSYKRLGDLVRIKHGYAFEGRYFTDIPRGSVLVTPGNFEIGGGWKEADRKYYAGPVPPGFALRKGDLIVTMTDLSKNADTLGYPAMVPGGGPYLHNQRIGLIELQPGAEVDPRFLYYALRSREYRWHVLASATGTTVRHTSPSRILDFKFSLPDLRRQNAIADVLGALDDKIELNRKTLATLEELARALFASWFGVLDPENAPAGWTVASLGDHVKAMRGLSYTGAGLTDDGIPLHNLNSIYEGGGYKYEGIKHYRGDYKDRHVVRASDLLVVNTEQGFDHLLIGFPALVPARFGDLSLYSADLFQIEPWPDSHLTTRFLYLALMSPRLRQIIVGYSNGTTVNHLAADGLQRPRLAVPPADLIKRFDSTVAPLFAKQEQLQLESETLAQMRDLLLPKLMSGEVRFKETDKAAAEAL